MLSTFLTRSWGLKVPVVGAPMSPIGQSVGLLERIEPAAEIVGRIARDAEAHLRAASSSC